MWTYLIITETRTVAFLNNNALHAHPSFDHFILTPTQFMWHQQHDNSAGMSQFRKTWLAARDELIQRGLIEPFR
jgi:hypothetical protein